MRALLVTSAPPEKSPFSTTEKRPPLGVGTLISMGREAGHEIHFIDNYLERSNFELNGYLIKNRIEVVGIYSNTICFRDTLRMLRALQHLRDEGVWEGEIAVGGPHTSVLPETIPKYVDYVVMGEGEGAWLDILNGVAAKGFLQYPRLMDLDLLPFQPWDLFVDKPYDWACPWMEGSTPVFTMNTSRGCPFKCAFCSVGSVWGPKYTTMSAERIVAEIKYLVENHGAKGIYFREDNFTLDKKRLARFCELMKAEGLTHIHWACETRVDNMTMGRVRDMAEAGCRAFYLGVESGSEKILALVNKNINVNQIRDMIVWGKMFGINCYASLITGVPGETIEDFLETERLMVELDPYHWGYNVFVGIPWSDLYHKAIRDDHVEYTDINGLVYPPGYDIKAKFFYGEDACGMVDHKFTERTQFDKDLLRLRPWWIIHKKWLWVKRMVRGLVG